MFCRGVLGLVSLSDMLSLASYSVVPAQSWLVGSAGQRAISSWWNVMCSPNPFEVLEAVEPSAEIALRNYDWMGH